MSREPRVGCGVALLKDGALLLIRRLKEPEAGTWSLPGGKIDWGEAAEIAAARELAEELDVRANGLSLLCMAQIIDRGDGEHWIAPVYLAEGFEGEPKLLEPHKHGGFGWFALDALPQPLAISAEAAVQALARR